MIFSATNAGRSSKILLFLMEQVRYITLILFDSSSSMHLLFLISSRQQDITLIDVIRQCCIQTLKLFPYNLLHCGDPLLLPTSFLKIFQFMMGVQD